MGVVDLAVGPDGAPVARKRLPLYGSAGEIEQARRRLRREAEVLASLHHPGIVPLLAVEDDGDDVVLVMPYLPGGTLAERVAEHGPMAPAAVDRLAAQLLDALAAAHRSGVVHRDIKPANVLFDAHGNALLTDFGVASGPELTAGLTGAGLVVGTPAFMAPEQARGDTATAASDVFSLGATLRFALTAEGPWGSGPPAALVARAAGGRAAPLPRALPRDLRRRLDALVERDPRRRPSAAAVLGGIAGTSPGTQHRRPASPGRLAVALTAGLVVAASVAAGFAWRASPRPSEAAAAPRPAPPLVCAPGHADDDGIRANGCEAAPDTVDGTTLRERLTANLVPADDVDRYPFRVLDHFQLFCDGELRLTLTSPPGVAQRLEVLDDRNELLGQSVSDDGTPAVVQLADPGCFSDDGGMFTARVSTVTGHTAATYTLRRSGSF